MSSYSSDSKIDRRHHHDRLGHSVKPFGHGRSLHSIFGGGIGNSDLMLAFRKTYI